MKYMLDTNICIFVMRGKNKDILNRILKASDDGICISSITLAELTYGVEKSRYRERNLDSLIKFLTLISVKDFNQKAAEEYGRIRTALELKGTVIGPLDMLIASHAISEKLTLISHNTKEFERVEGLMLENWVADNFQ